MSARIALAARRRRTVLILGITAMAVLVALFWPRPGSVAANPLTGIEDVATGEWHTCALMTTGGVKCWGDNDFGQLGDGSNVDSATPVNVSGLGSGVASITAGGDFTCAVTTEGGAKCWGHNDQGQLGDGTTADSNVPVDVAGLGSGVASMEGGYEHVCAVTASGGLRCWGENGAGRLGNGGTDDSATPVDVVGLSSGVSAVTASGFDHTCALLATGAMKCWGSNSYGQLGDGSTTHSTTPVDVAGLGGSASAITSGIEYSCALMTTGGVKCWGFGFGTAPVELSGLASGVAEISASSLHLCAVTTGGGIKCRGQNGFGQLGDGTTTKSITPVDVVGFASGGASVAPGYVHTCAVTTSGGAKCWGFNGSGQLGNGTTSGYAPNPEPMDVVELTEKPTPTNTPCGPSGCPTPTDGPTPPPQTGLDFSLGIDVDGDTTDDCGTDAGAEGKCSVPGDSTFTLKVYLNSLPVDVYRYGGFDIRLGYAGVGSKDNASAAPWPDCAFPARLFGPDFVVFGCAIGPGLPGSTYVGVIGAGDFGCTESGTITMVHGFAATTLWEDAHLPHDEGEGATETLTINCVQPPTPTPAAPPIGGVGVFPDVGYANASDGSVAFVVATVFAAMAAVALVLGGAVWRWRTRRLG